MLMTALSSMLETMVLGESLEITQSHLKLLIQKTTSKDVQDQIQNNELEERYVLNVSRVNATSSNIFSVDLKVNIYDVY